jgi:predicted porin
MHRKHIAVATALVATGLAAPVMAQSNVTVYGVADAFLGYGKTEDAKFIGVQSGGWAGSRLGFRGTEDLGNGLKAVFTLEYGIEIDSNTGVGAGGSLGRQQFVGLQGGFGFVGLGRQYSPGYFVFKYDAIVPVPISPQFALASSAGSNNVAGGAARVSNSVNYKSPTFGGVTLNAIYGFNETNQTGNRQKNDLAAIGADYANGPLAVGLIYSQVNDQAGDKNKRDAYLGAAYDFGMFKLSGSYQRIENATAAEDTDNVWQIGGTVPVGAAGKIAVSYGRLDADAQDSDANAWALVYSHTLSKRTTAYAGYGQINNDDGRAVRSPSFVSAANTGLGDTSRNLLLGLNHTF